MKITSFKDLYEKYMFLLNESPFSTGKAYGELFDNEAINREHAKKITSKLNKESDFNYGGIDFEIWTDNNDLLKELYVIDSQYPQICAYVYYQIKNNIIEERGIWNKRNYPGLVRYLYIQYFLKKYQAIVSNSQHSLQAQKMWTMLFEDYNKEYVFSVFNDLTNETKRILNSMDIENYYSNTSHNLRLVISKEDFA